MIIEGNDLSLILTKVLWYLHRELEKRHELQMNVLQQGSLGILWTIASNQTVTH